MNYRNLESIKTVGQLIPFVKHMLDNFTQVSVSNRSGLMLSYIDDEHGLYQFHTHGSDTSLTYTQRRLADSDMEHKYDLGGTSSADYLKMNGRNKMIDLLRDNDFYI